MLSVRHCFRQRAPALPAQSKRSAPAVSLSNPLKGFTIVEVMMASVILVVGFLGMIQAVTVGSEMLATARRQTIAGQILDHEIGKLRLKAWDLPSSTDDIVGLDDSAAAAYTSDQTALNTAISASGVTFTLERDVTDLTTDLREITFIVTWTKGGTTTAATTATGSWLEKLSFSGSAPISRTYTRKSTAYFGKYGLNLNLQRS
jgi:Tfp pilus assembly protein PilV